MKDTPESILLFLFQNPRDQSIQLVGKCLDVFLVQRFGARRFHASGSELLHQVARRQTALYAVIVVEFSACSDCHSTLFNDAGGQRNIAGDRNVAGIEHFNDPVVGDVSAVRNGHDVDQVGSRNAHRLIGDEYDFDS